jgi:hypothetical protein
MRMLSHRLLYKSPKETLTHVIDVFVACLTMLSLSHTTQRQIFRVIRLLILLLYNKSFEVFEDPAG